MTEELEQQCIKAFDEKAPIGTLYDSFRSGYEIRDAELQEEIDRLNQELSDAYDQIHDMI